MNDKCQTKFTRTVEMVQNTIEEVGKKEDAFIRLHAILCMDHSMDQTAAAVLNSLIDLEYVAWAMDQIASGKEVNFTDYLNQEAA